MLRFVANLALVLILAGAAVVTAEACNGRAAPARQYQCQVRPAPTAAVVSTPCPAAQRKFCICTPDENGVMRVRGTTSDKAKAERAVELLKENGFDEVWAMEMKPVPQGGGLTLSNGEAAIAIAYNIGPGRTRAAAIGGSGRAEAIAQN
jgi:hypothetical protein